MQKRVPAFVLGSALLVAACGGGGGGGSGPGVPPPTVTPPAPPPTGQTPLTFQNASVHDPSIIKVGAEYYVFGSHLAAAKSTDLMNWTLIADRVDNTNPLFTNVLTALQPTFAWSTVQDLWAPDVARLPDGKFYFYYD